MGEGGGQILRSALALSLILGEPVRIDRVRAGRPVPGMKAQHLTAVRALAEIGNAELRGAQIGSTDIEFVPGEIRGGRYELDAGTAGSITLMIQAILPPLLMAKEPSEVFLRGGTDVKWSPPADYTKNVFLSALRRMGADVEMEILRRGYYPKGGGDVLLKVRPSKLREIVLEGGDVRGVRGVAHCSKLPKHIGKRMKHEVMKEFPGIDVRIRSDCSESLSPGAGIVLWSEGEGYAIGGSYLGERGVPAENVGRIGALDIKKAFGYGLDEHLADQILIYMHMAGGRVLAPIITSHAETAMRLLEMMTGEGFSVKKGHGFLIEKRT